MNIEPCNVNRNSLRGIKKGSIKKNYDFKTCNKLTLNFNLNFILVFYKIFNFLNFNEPVKLLIFKFCNFNFICLISSFQKTLLTSLGFFLTLFYFFC
jgi:hypothetical protein